METLQKLPGEPDLIWTSESYRINVEAAWGLGREVDGGHESRRLLGTPPVNDVTVVIP